MSFKEWSSAQDAPKKDLAKEDPKAAPVAAPVVDQPEAESEQGPPATKP